MAGAHILYRCGAIMSSDRSRSVSAVSDRVLSACHICITHRTLVQLGKASASPLGTLHVTSPLEEDEERLAGEQRREAEVHTCMASRVLATLPKYVNGGRLLAVFSLAGAA